MSTLSIQRTSTKDITDEELQSLIQQNKSVYTQYYDAEYVDSIIKNLFCYLNPYYFRAKFIGFEHYPERKHKDKPLLFAGNHSGMAFPWDAMIFGAGLYEITHQKGIPSIRPLTAPALSETQLMNPYMVQDMWKRVGGIDATSLNFETMMHFDDADLLIYPEGVPGIGKGFDKRYQLQRFSTSMIRMSLKYDTDIIPVYSINGEYINPYSYRSKIINNIFQKVGIPYIPIGLLTLFIPLFPWVFYFGLPANFHFVLGKRISPTDYAGGKSFEDMSFEEIQKVRDIVQHNMQAQLDDAVEKYGQQPYKWKELFKSQFSNLSKFWTFFPATWALMFAEHERQYKRFKKDGTPVNIDDGIFAVFKWMFRNPIYIFFLIPVIGWIPLLIRGYSNQKKVPK